MATITGLTAARMLGIEANSVVSGEVVDGDLILTRQGGATINAGDVRGPERYIGELIPLAGATVPSRCLACDGAAVSRATYAALFSEIGTTYGAGNGTTTFNLPSLKGKTMVMKDTLQTEFDTLGESGGAKTHTLTGNESGVNSNGSTTSSGSGTSGAWNGTTGAMSANASHNHGVHGSYVTTGGSAYIAARWDGANANVGGIEDTNTDHTHSVPSHTHSTPAHSHPLTGRTADSAHNNLQPYLTVNMVIYAGV